VPPEAAAVGAYHHQPAVQRHRRAEFIAGGTVGRLEDEALGPGRVVEKIDLAGDAGAWRADGDEVVVAGDGAAEGVEVCGIAAVEFGSLAAAEHVEEVNRARIGALVVVAGGADGDGDAGGGDRAAEFVLGPAVAGGELAHQAAGIDGEKINRARAVALVVVPGRADNGHVTGQIDRAAGLVAAGGVRRGELPGFRPVGGEAGMTRTARMRASAAAAPGRKMGWCFMRFRRSGW
jgi:hypothetical protein